MVLLEVGHIRLAQAQPSPLPPPVGGDSEAGGGKVGGDSEAGGGTDLDVAAHSGPFEEQPAT